MPNDTHTPSLPKEYLIVVSTYTKCGIPSGIDQITPSTQGGFSVHTPYNAKALLWKTAQGKSSCLWWAKSRGAHVSHIAWYMNHRVPAPPPLHSPSTEPLVKYAGLWSNQDPHKISCFHSSFGPVLSSTASSHSSQPRLVPILNNCQVSHSQWHDFLEKISSLI